MWGAKSNLIVGGAVGEGTGTAAAIMKKDRGEEVSLSGGQSEEVGVRSQESEVRSQKETLRDVQGSNSVPSASY